MPILSLIIITGPEGFCIIRLYGIIQAGRALPQREDMLRVIFPKETVSPSEIEVLCAEVSATLQREDIPDLWRE